MTDELNADDRDLRDLLGALDPAASLPPADPTRVARLLEDTMTDQLTDESRTDGTHHRSGLTWLVASAAALVIGGGVLFAVTSGDDEPVPTAGTDDPPASQSTPAQSVTTLSVNGAAVNAKCLAPLENPQVVAEQSLAFDGTVTSISGSKVTLEPTAYYTGDETDLVVVEAPSDDMAMLLSSVTFQEGGRYLVSATDGQVTLCGFSAEYSDELAGVYAEAFPG